MTLTKPNGEVIARPKVLRRWWERARGFMFRRKLEPGEALLFVNPRETIADAAIHMLFVGMPLGVIWLDSEGRVVDMVLAKPWRMHYAPRLPAKYILEGKPDLTRRLTLGTKVVFMNSEVEKILQAALAHGKPEIFNTDQGAQFTAHKFTSRLVDAGIRVSMDGRGRALDNVFVERLWRSVKYEDVYLRDYTTVPDLNAGLDCYFSFYNHERPHQSLDYEVPATVHLRAVEPALC